MGRVIALLINSFGDKHSFIMTYFHENKQEIQSFAACIF